MYKLEHGVKDEQKSKAAQPTLGQLQVIWTVNLLTVINSSTQTPIVCDAFWLKVVY